MQPSSCPGFASWGFKHCHQHALSHACSANTQSTASAAFLTCRVWSTQDRHHARVFFAHAETIIPLAAAFGLFGSPGCAHDGCSWDECTCTDAECASPSAVFLQRQEQVCMQACHCRRTAVLPVCRSAQRLCRSPRSMDLILSVGLVFAATE